jgi:hypothetical protein
MADSKTFASPLDFVSSHLIAVRRMRYHYCLSYSTSEVDSVQDRLDLVVIHNLPRTTDVQSNRVKLISNRKSRS